MAGLVLACPAIHVVRRMERIAGEQNGVESSVFNEAFAVGHADA